MKKDFGALVLSAYIMMIIFVIGIGVFVLKILMS